jgi:hypothetical protein
MMLASQRLVKPVKNLLIEQQYRPFMAMLLCRIKLSEQQVDFWTGQGIYLIL